MTSLNTKLVKLESASSQKALNVLILPDCRSENPYQDLLAQSLEANIEVVFPQGYRRFLPLFRQVLQQSPRVDVLHLHWISPYLRGTSRLARTIYAVKFLIDVILVKWCGVRVVWTIHNQIGHEAVFPGLERWVRRRLAG